MVFTTGFLSRFEGPVINQQPTFVTLYTAAQFRAFPYLAQLRHLINEGFAKNHGARKTVTWERLDYDNQILGEMGNDALIWVISVQASSTRSGQSTDLDPDGGHTRYGDTKIYGFVSARPVYSEAVVEVSEDLRRFKNSAVPGPGIEQWEVNLLSVDSSLQGRVGLGSMLMALVEGEVEKRFRAKQLVSNDGMAGSVGLREGRISLSTVKEVNYAWYVRKGYELTSEQWFEKGTRGSDEGFTYVNLMKILVKG